MKALSLLLVVLASLAGALAGAQQQPPPGSKQSFYDSARGPVPILESTHPPRLGNAVNDDIRRTRNYTMQPPTIPHRVDGYQVDKNFNKCLDCHARTRTEMTQAIPVSATHYMDRDGRTLGQVSTRRYFCQQCHVPQDAVAPFVANDFEDVDTVIRKSQAAARAQEKK